MAQYLGRVAAVTLAYVVAGRVGLWLAFEHGSVSPVWPPTGLALSALLLLGRSYWPGVFLGALIVNGLTPVSWPGVLGVAIGNTVEAVAGVYLLERSGFRKAFERLEDVFRLVFFGSLVSTAISATIGVASLCLVRSAPWHMAGRLWWQWWLGDGMGDLVLVPLLLTWSRPRPSRAPGGRIEALLLGFGLVSIGAWVFLRPFDKRLLDDSYWLFPFVVGAALRFGQRGVATITVGASGIAIFGTVRGLGPFTSESTASSLMLLQAFLGVLAATGLILGAVTSERRSAEETIRALNEDLERRVQARTVELATANRELTKTNEENEAFVFSVSHDLRSPLVNLEGFSAELALSAKELREVVEDEVVPAPTRSRATRLLDVDMRESIQFIQTAVGRLSGHIDALLRLSRAGRVEYRSERVELERMVLRIVESMHGTIVMRGARIDVAALPPAFGDATALEQVFANLIGNALNYLDEARPLVIRIGSRASSDDAAFRTYFVEDNGLGIPAGLQRKAFQAFQRLHPNRAKGEGLGLAIVRRVVERHGGSTWLESTEGQGSCFHVKLPVVPPTTANESTLGAADERAKDSEEAR